MIIIIFYNSVKSQIFSTSIDVIVGIIIGLVSALVLWLIFHFIKKRLRINISMNAHFLTITADKSLVQTSHSLYVQLITTKLAIPFNVEEDSISEVYKSFYSSFTFIREIMKNIHLNSDHDKKLFTYLENFLNNELRSHLQKYQLKYRGWLEREKKNDLEFTNEIDFQKKYDYYQDIISGIKNINIKSKELSQIIYELAYKKASLLKIRRKNTIKGG